MGLALTVWNEDKYITMEVSEVAQIKAEVLEHMWIVLEVFLKSLLV